MRRKAERPVSTPDHDPVDPRARLPFDMRDSGVTDGHRTGRETDSGVFVRLGARCGVVGLCALFVGSPASATTYRCDVEGRVLYSDAPCAAGRQSTVTTVDPVDATERAAAAARLRHDQATLAQIDRQHAVEREQDLRAAALGRKRNADQSKRIDACGKLAKRARNAHDAFDIAGPRDQPKARLRMQRADEDFAALCKH